MSKNNTSENSVDIVSKLVDALNSLLDSTEGISKADLKKLKNDSQQALNQATDYLKQNGTQLADKAKQAAVAAEGYVKENPWKSAAITAMLAYSLTVLFTRKNK